MRFKLIVATVQQELTDKLIDTAQKAGATGATIIPARGIGSEQKKIFFGLTIEGPVDVVLLLIEEHVADDILRALNTTCKFEEPGVGIAFVVPVDDVTGIESQMKKFRKQARDQYF